MGEVILTMKDIDKSFPGVQTCALPIYLKMFLQMDTGMIPQTWTAKKSLLTFMTNR